MSEPDSGLRLSDAQKFHWLRLIRCENVGPRTFQTLVNRFGGAAAALDALPDLISQRAGTGRSIKIATMEETEQELEAAHKLGVTFVATAERDYPKNLRVIDAPPPLIAVRGRLEALREPMVALVGSRNASAAGLAFTERLARGVGRAGLVVVSGLARGVDARAHQASLQTGTIAVLAGGHEKIYPAEHMPLLERILEQGAVISEMPIAWEPRGRDFPRRNRIVSGLSLGVVVIEAAIRSGSLITADFAAQQGREVFAVPGSPLDPRAEGPNNLIREGAHICTRVEDVVNVLTPLAQLEPEQGNLKEDDTPSHPEQEPLWDEWDFLDGEGQSSTPHDIAARRHTNILSAQKGLQGSLFSAPSLKEDEHAFAPLVPAENLGVKQDRGTKRSVHHSGSPRESIVSLLGPSPASIDDLIRLSGATASQVQTVLLELELEGRLFRHGAGLVSIDGATRDSG